MSSTSPAPATPPADLPVDPSLDQPADATTDMAAATDGDTAAGKVADADAEAVPEAALEATSDGAATQAKPAAPQVSPAETLAKLAELFPALFKGAPKPFKLRIQVDIQERAPGVFTKQALSAFFRRHTGATSYLIAVSKGTQRFDLDGQPAGELSEEHRKVAADELARRRANVNAKREQENAQREQEEAGRRQRASLLRDFETTKLTTANFCALKGVAADQLDGLLAQARAEALEDAQRPRRPEHGHGHGQPRRGEGPGGRRDGGNRGPGHGPRADGDAPRGGPRPNGRPGNRPDQGPRNGPRQGPRADGRPGNGPRPEQPQDGAPASGEGRKEGRPPRRG